MTSPEIADYLDAQAPESDRWRQQNRYYYEEIERIVRFHVPPGSSVLEIGCGALEPSRGVGVDISPKAVEIARAKHARRSSQEMRRNSLSPGRSTT
jgi:SAM-dependent methyltransferase